MSGPTGAPEAGRAGLDAAAFGALHVLAVKGAARADQLAAADGRSETELLRQLQLLHEQGCCRHWPKRDMWRITEDGRTRHAAKLAGDTPPAARERLDRGYRLFLPLNGRFKELCTRWQLRDGAPNDHRDREYDAALVTELGGIHTEATALLAELAAARASFGRYATRLADALRRIGDGETNAFTGVMTESYHDVWMDLHRDLLLTLGIDRADEEAAAISGSVHG